MNESLKLYSHYEDFLHESIRIVKRKIDSFSDSDCYIVKRADKQTKPEIVEAKTKNWWQIPQSIRIELITSKTCAAFINALEKQKPFCDCIGKAIYIREKSIAYGEKIISGFSIAEMLLSSYLSQRTLDRWSSKFVEKLWFDFLNFFNPDITSIEYCLYSPIYSMEYLKKNIYLPDGFSIRKLNLKKIASLASNYQSLIGYQIFPRKYKWPTYYFTKKFSFPKKIVDQFDWDSQLKTDSFQLTLNNEIAFLRCLLVENISILNYEFVQENSTFLMGPKEVNNLPWKASLILGQQPQDPTNISIRHYISWRKKLIQLPENKNKGIMFESMKRFSVAWENPFRADILADLVSALEKIVVNDHVEVSYKLRVRVSHFLGKSINARKEIFRNIEEAYNLRSTVFHGGYILDNFKELDLKDKKSNIKIAENINEINRLIPILAKYYRQLLVFMIEENLTCIDWKSLGM